MQTAENEKASGSIQQGTDTSSIPGEREALHFHYIREERLKKLRIKKEPKRPRIFANRRIRSLIIIFIDLVLVALVIYLLNKPVNLYLKEREGDVLYELNVSGIKGGKVMIGLTLQNQTDVQMSFSRAVPVVIQVQGKNNQLFTFQKSIEENTVLEPHEATSVIFLIDERSLPASGQLAVYIRDSQDPLFFRTVRF
jgi:hypothetical protein